MGRSKGAKNKPSSRFKAWEGENPKDRHVRLTKHMMTTPVYMSLSSSSKALYAYMKLWAGQNDTVIYSHTMAKDIMTKNTFFAARNELIEKGFIEYVNGHRARHTREAAEYAFSEGWYTRVNAML